MTVRRKTAQIQFTLVSDSKLWPVTLVLSRQSCCVLGNVAEVISYLSTPKV